MSLRLKIFATFVLLTLATVTLVAVLVERRFTAEVRNNLSDFIRNGIGVVEAFNDLNIKRVINEASQIGTDPRLRASLATMDVETIAQTANSFALAEDAPLLLVLSSSEEYLTGRGLPESDIPFLAQQPAVSDAMNGFEAGDYWLVEGKLLIVAASPVITGNRRLGILVLGKTMGADFLNDLQQITSSHFGLVVADRVVHNTISHDKEAVNISLIDLDSEIPAEFSAAGHRFMGARVSLDGAQGDHLGSLVIYRSLEEALAALDPIRTSIVIIAMGSIAFALFASYFLSLGVTRPVEALARRIRLFGTGDYDDPVEIHSNDEVGILAASFEEMRLSLQIAQDDLVSAERLSTVGQMANGIIHDFKQPITTIQGFTELICKADLTEENRREYGEMILGSIQQMLGMINDLLDFARGEASLHLEEADLNNVVNNAKNQLHGVMADHGIVLNFSPGDIGPVQLDRLRIQRVIENLISNAGEAISGKGEITLETLTSNGGIELLVTDTGSGVPLELQDTLFEPFVTMGKPSGTGLGLSVAKNIVEEHGGSISYQTEADKGTTFHIWFPANAA